MESRGGQGCGVLMGRDLRWLVGWTESILTIECLGSSVTASSAVSRVTVSEV